MTLRHLLGPVMDGHGKKGDAASPFSRARVGFEGDAASPFNDEVDRSPVMAARDIKGDAASPLGQHWSLVGHAHPVNKQGRGPRRARDFKR